MSNPYEDDDDRRDRAIEVEDDPRELYVDTLGPEGIGHVSDLDPPDDVGPIAIGVNT